MAHQIKGTKINIDIKFCDFIDRDWFFVQFYFLLIYYDKCCVLENRNSFQWQIKATTSQFSLPKLKFSNFSGDIG